jgi:hypothetical protein
MRRPWLLAQFALVGALAVLASPSSGSALRAVGIVLTANGPSPVVETIPAGLYPVWVNNDTVTHTLAFANGQCTLQLAPGSVQACNNSCFSQLGQYGYTVDGTVQASIVVVAEGRSVTLTAKRHAIRRRARLRLHGELTIPILSPPAPPAPQPVIVYARNDRHHAFRRIRVVTAKTHGWTLRWQLHVRPGSRRTYIVEANSQPKGGPYWQRAWSSPFTVRVRH